MDETRMKKIIKMLEWKLVERKVSIDMWSPINWAWGVNNELMVIIDKGFSFFNLTEKEVERVATTSCGPVLWAIRAIGLRLGWRVKVVDAIYYNK